MDENGLRKVIDAAMDNRDDQWTVAKWGIGYAAYHHGEFVTMAESPEEAFQYVDVAARHLVAYELIWQAHLQDSTEENIDTDAVDAAMRIVQGMDKHTEEAFRASLAKLGEKDSTETSLLRPNKT